MAAMVETQPLGSDADEHSGHRAPRSSPQHVAATEAAARDKLYDAIESGDEEQSRQLIAEWPVLASDIEHLIRAAYLGRVRIAANMLSAGARAGESDESGHTPLMAAASAGHLEVVQMLISANADPSALVGDVEPRIDSDRRGESAMYYALEHGHRDVAEFLAPLTSPWLRLRAEFAVADQPSEAVEALARAAAEGDRVTAQSALKLGANPSARCGKERRTALHAAAAAGHADIVELLLNAGADANARDKFGQTVLWKVARNGDLAITRLLLARGADVEARDFDSEQTPLMQAVLLDRPEVVNALLAAGADPRATDADGLSALDYAACQDVPAARSALEREKGT